MVQFKNWIWNLLPEYFNRDDSYKDDNNKGLLQRYVEMYGEEMDENFIPYMENILDLIDATRCDDKYLKYLSYTLGSPISIDNNTATYRKLLQYAVAIYKIKGTKRSYQLLFNLIGVDVDIIEELPLKALTYDSDHFYDENPIQHYDQECEYCSYYTITYSNINDTTEPTVITDIPPDLFAKFSNIICFLQPINAKLRGYQKKITFYEEFPLSLEDEITGFNLESTGGAFDGGFDGGFDNGEITG